MKAENQYARFGRQVGYVIGADIVLMVLSLIQLPLLTKSLGSSLYGIWSLISVTISLIVPFALLGLDSAVVRFLAAEKDKNKIREDFYSACFAVFMAGLVFSALILLCSDFIAASIFKDAGSSPYIKLASVLVIFTSLETLALAFFRTQKRMGLYSALIVIHKAVEVCLILSSLLLNNELAGVITAIIAAGVFFCLLELYIILRRSGPHIPRFSTIKSYLKWGLPLTANSALLWVINSSDRYIVNHFLGIDATGIYSAAYGLSLYAIFFLAPVATVLYPTITQLYSAGDMNETRVYLKHSFKYFMTIAIPSAFGLSILAKSLLTILTRPEFTSGYIVIPFVASGAVMFSLFRFGLYIIFLSNKTYLAAWLLGAAALLNVLLNILFIPTLGIMGAGIATLVSFGALGIVTLFVSRLYFKFDLDTRFLGKSILASTIMTICIWLIDPNSIITTIIAIMAGVIIYFSLLLFTKGLTKNELLFLFNIARG